MREWLIETAQSERERGREGGRDRKRERARARARAHEIARECEQKRARLSEGLCGDTCIYI